MEIEVVLVYPEDSATGDRFQAIAMGALSIPKVFKSKQAALIGSSWRFLAIPLAELELALENEVKKIE